jgi:surface antigen
LIQCHHQRVQLIEQYFADAAKNMKRKSFIYIFTVVLILGLAGSWIFKNFNFNSTYSVGQPIDSLNGVIVYYNGGVNNVTERNSTKDGYNLGLKYQCVEFVKRYYYEKLKHRMPDSYGHARDFFDAKINDGEKNEKRNLNQYTNPSKSQPEVDDLLVFSGTIFNKYGHVAIVSKVMDHELEIIQQNPGPYGQSREVIALENKNGKWAVKNDRVLGWLRKE